LFLLNYGIEVVIPADMQLEVTYSITNSGGLPLDAEGVYTPGPVDMRFTIANIPMGEEQKVRLAYARTSRGDGILTSVSPGVYKYKFKTVLMSDMYDAAPRDVVSTETCNRCHDPLAEHGSRWS
jgi:hypothetical protein